MKKLALAVAIVTLGAAALIATAVAKNGVGNNGGGRAFSAKLHGFEEVPAVSTPGTGRIHLRLIEGGTQLEYRFTYRDLQGSLVPETGDPPVVGQAHIHFGQFSVNGGISAFLCGGGDKPPCPTTNPATVTGIIDAGDVIGPAGQGIAAGEFTELIRAMRHGVTYANIHTDQFPGGEIRGQIDGGRHFGGFRGRDKDDD
jgi:hypothetical protein